MEKPRRTVNPQFRLDVDGRLFKQTATNQDLQDTLIFDDLYSRFCIVKGDLPLFPNIGLKQHLYTFGFVEEPEAMLHKEDFENVSMDKDDLEEYAENLNSVEVVQSI